MPKVKHKDPIFATLENNKGAVRPGPMEKGTGKRRFGWGKGNGKGIFKFQTR